MKRRTIFHSLLIIFLCRLVVINNHNFSPCVVSRTIHLQATAPIYGSIWIIFPAPPQIPGSGFLGGAARFHPVAPEFQESFRPHNQRCGLAAALFYPLYALES